MKKIDTDKIVKDIEKSKGVKKERRKGLTFDSGCDMLDLVIGKYPAGITNIVGDSSTGKSFIAGECIANAYHRYKDNKKFNFDWFYDNVETGYKIDSETLYGFNIVDDGYFKESQASETIEDFEYKINEIISKKNKADRFIYVLDSFDSLTDAKEKKYMAKKRSELKKKKEGSDSDDTGSYGLDKQKFMHQFCRTYIRKLESNNILLIIISQVKIRIGFGFGGKYIRTGGKALDFFPQCVFWLAETEKYTKEKRAVGICIKARATKTRDKQPFRTCNFDLIFDYGIDNINSNLKFLFGLKTDTGKDKKKIEIEFNGVEFNKITDAVLYVEENNLEQELKKQTIKKWQDIEESISSKDRKKKW